MKGLNSVESRAGTPAKPPRYGFVDLLRGFAILVMVETHVVNAYLPHESREGSHFFFWLAFINGLVAPSFLFATGFSLILQSNRHWENWLRFRLPFWRQMRRLGFIFLVAYNLHLQGFGIRWYLKHRDSMIVWERTFKVDVLQCIVVSLLVLLLLIFIVRRKGLLPYAVGFVGVAVALATPWIWAQDFRQILPLGLALFLNPHGISLFPLFPWMFFVLAGAFASHYFLKAVESGNLSRYMNWTAGVGLWLIVSGLLLRWVPVTLPGYVNFYKTSPLYVMIRLGCVLMICVLLHKSESGVRWLQAVQTAGRESLLVYGAHLWLIYTVLRGRFVAPILGKELNYAGCFLLSAAIIAVMIVIARHWHVLKSRYPHEVRLGQGAIIIVMLTGFLLL